MIKNILNTLLKFPAPIFTVICLLVMVWFNDNTTITQTKANTIIVETPYVIFSYNSDEVKFDSLHPLKAYSCYKVDIFGDKTPSYLCVKSDLMSEYKFTSFTRK